jgi:choline-sulfatase
MTQRGPKNLGPTPRSDPDKRMPDTGSNRRATVVRHITLAATTALIVGVVDGLWGAHRAGQSPLLAAALSAGTLAAAGALVGLAQAVLVMVVSPVLERRGWLARWRAAMNADPEGERTPVVAFHAWVATVLAVGAPLVLGLAYLLRRSERIKEVALRDAVLVMGAAGALIMLLVVSAMALPILERACEKVDRSWGLPRPRSRLLRYALFVALPVGLLLVPMFTQFGVKLGVLAAPFALALFFTAEGLLWQLAQAISDRWLQPGGGANVLAVRLLAGLLVVVFAGALALFELWPGASAALSGGDVAPSVAVRLQRLTDVDRDGVSSLFGGTDCAAFDSGRSPMKTEVPNNGIDEDCDGQDARAAGRLPELTPYYGELLDSQTKRYNVLLLVVDSLRPDHLGAYGYEKKTSPYMDELAKDAWLFTRAYSQSSTTALSMPSMLSGRRPSSMRWKGGYPQTMESEPMLPDLLREQGYDTTLAINRYVVRHLKGMQRDFEQVLTVPEGADWKSGEYIISNVISAVEDARRAERPFFVVAHFDDVHHPYRAHLGRSVPDFPSSIRNVAAYDRCIANFDNMLRFLTSYLQQAGVWDDTILILTADHGEEFREHGGAIHSLTCYVESVHVPLIVRIPGFEPMRISSRVALTDLVPTLLEAMSLPSSRFSVDGQSLFVPALAPERVPVDRPIFCSIFQLLEGRKDFFTRSVRTSEHVLVYETLSDRVELYDAVADPRESQDIAASNPETVAGLREFLGASATGNLWEARRFQ